MKHILLLLLLGFGLSVSAASKFVPIGRSYTSDTVVYTSPVQGTREVRASGSVQFTGNYGYVRIILSVAGDKDYLIYECYPLLAEGPVVEFEGVHEESSIPGGIGAFQVRVEIESASLYLQNLELRDTSPSSLSLRIARESNQADKISRINTNLRSRQMLWFAGETSISGLSFEEKKGLFGGQLPDLQGYEYYKGGIFQLVGNDTLSNSLELTSGDSLYVDSYDWRSRHGANDPNSPYYNPGSPDGWITPVRDQKDCGSCWAFSAVGALEGFVNLHFNRFLNPDLSEQEIVSCNTFGSDCRGGLVTVAANYIKNNGIVEESCFPYANKQAACIDKCATPETLVSIAGYSELKSQPSSEVKKTIIQGPIAGALSNWLHAMTIVGYKTLRTGDTIRIKQGNNGIFFVIPENDPRIGKTAWLCKNSYGTGFGENGYAFYLDNPSTLSASVILSLPIYHTGYAETDIVCEDRDGDGYYWWGTGAKPSTCPPDILDEPDGDDSDPTLGPMNEYGHIATVTPHVYPATEITTTLSWAGSSYLNGNLVIKPGGELILTGNLVMPHHCKIEVQSGGILTVDGGHIVRGDIQVKSGGRFTMKNNALVEMATDDRFNAESGGIVNMPYGHLNNIN